VHTNDRVVPPHRQRKLAAALPDAIVIEVETDHGGVSREPDLYVPALVKACSSIAARVARPAAA